MGYKTVFERCELKYIVNDEQLSAVKSAMKGRMHPDKYGKMVIRNVYFDTDTYELIRRSIEKPDFKEKFRVRCYTYPIEDTPVFAELKMKYKGVVYKRRIDITYSQYIKWFINKQGAPKSSQITKEIDYFFERKETCHQRCFCVMSERRFLMKPTLFA